MEEELVSVGLLGPGLVVARLLVAAFGASDEAIVAALGQPVEFPETQLAWIERTLADHQDVRWTFLFTHKAPWLAEEPNNFATIENALAGRRYTVFHGHVHGYQHQERNGNDYIRLATTGGVQFTDRGLSADHVTLVTVSDSGVDIATLLMSGILDKTGNIPLDGNEMCFNLAECGERATPPE